MSDRASALRACGLSSEWEPSGATRAVLERFLVARFPLVSLAHFKVERVSLEELREAVREDRLPSRIAVLVGLEESPREAALRSGLEDLARSVDLLSGKVADLGTIPPPPPLEAGEAFVPTEELASLASVVVSLAGAGRRSVLGLVGPAGCGKSSAARWIASEAGLPFSKIDCSTALEPSDWFGSMTLRDGSTVWDDGPFSRAVSAPGVVLLDEANRCAPSVMNGLLPVLDDQREVSVPGRPDPVRVSPGVVFVLSLNMGAAYSGTEALDRALSSRVTAWAEVGPPLEEAGVLHRRTGLELERCGELVAFARRVREEKELEEEGVSTRALIACAELLRFGAGLERALESAIVLSFSSVQFGERRSPRARVRELAREVFNA